MSHKRSSPRTKPSKRASEGESSTSLSFFETSPSKKKKLSSEQLRTLTTENRLLPIGELLTLPKERNGFIIRGDTEKTLGCTLIQMQVVIVDNRIGRLAETEKGKKGNRFIYIADSTGYTSLGVDAESSGLLSYDLPESQCVDGAKLFFAAELSGTISWVPTKRDSFKTMFFMNKAKVVKCDKIAWNEQMWFTYPTSTVCHDLARSEFASSHLFSTVGFSGRLDTFVVNNSNSLVLYIQDVVSFAVIEVSFSGTCSTFNEKQAMEYLNEKKVVKNAIYFFAASMSITALDGHAWLKCNASELSIEAVLEEKYAEYGSTLLKRPYFNFPSTIDIPDTPDSP